MVLNSASDPKLLVTLPFPELSQTTVKVLNPASEHPASTPGYVAFHRVPKSKFVTERERINSVSVRKWVGNPCSDDEFVSYL
jgi:hypothetical protein